MNAPRIVQSLGVQAPGQPALFRLQEPAPSAGELWLETCYTGLSAGTELTFLKGTNPYLHARWDQEWGVFREGEPSATYPVCVLGYMEVAQVVESRSPAFGEGQLVGAAYGHRTGTSVHPQRQLVVPLPDGLDPLLGIYAAQMGPICANGLLHAAAESTPGEVTSLGDGVRGRRVLVLGGGVVGLLSGLFAAHHGADVVLADPDPMRLAAARGLGLHVVDDRDVPAWQECKDRWRHGPRDRGADLVLQCRGQAASLQTALQALRPQGSVIDLAFYQGGAADVRLGEEFHHNGLTIRCAQIGRVPHGQAPAWNRRRLAEETLEVLTAHADRIRHHLITDVVPLADGPNLMTELAARHRATIQAVFTTNQ